MTCEQAKTAMHCRSKVRAERPDLAVVGRIVEVDGDEAMVAHPRGTNSFYLDEIEEV